MKSSQKHFLISSLINLCSDISPTLFLSYTHRKVKNTKCSKEQKLKSWMKVLKIGSFLLLTISFSGFASLYTAVAYDEDGSYAAWATDYTQEKASKSALERCEKANHIGCHILFASGYVEARGASKTGMYVGDFSINKLKMKAIEICGDDDCDIFQVITNPGFFSVAMNSSGNDWYLQYGGENLDSVMAEAVKRCKERYDSECELISIGAIKGDLFPLSKNTVNKPKEAENCRPSTSAIKCSSSCVNGDCVVTYENGCQLRVQVRAEYDPLSNAWTYPAPSC